MSRSSNNIASSRMAADRHEMMIPQPSTAQTIEELNMWAANRHTTLISYTSLHQVDCKLLLISYPKSKVNVPYPRKGIGGVLISLSMAVELVGG